MKKRIATALAGLAVVMMLVACMGQDDVNIVDDKRELSVPGTTSVCYMMEVEIESAAGEEKGEHVYCADKVEYDQNRVGNEWRDKDGKIIK